MTSRSLSGARRARLFAPGLALLLALSACGSGGEGTEVVAGDAGPEPAPTASSSAAVLGRGPKAAERIPVTMRVEDWFDVDSAMESTSSVTTESGHPEEMPRASKADAITEAGDKQVRIGKKGKWPPNAQEVTITLTRAQWAFVLDDLRQWAEVGESMPDDPDMVQGSVHERATIALIERQLASPAKVLPGPEAPGTATRAGTLHHVESMDHAFWIAPFNAYPIAAEEWVKEQLLGISDGAVVVNTGVMWGKVELTVLALDAAPPPLSEGLGGWEVGEEETFEVVEPLHLFAPLGLDWAENAFVPAEPGLYRVRVLASGRIPDEGFEPTDGETGERYEVTFWPVTGRKPHLRYGDDQLTGPGYEPYSDHGDDEDFGDDSEFYEE